MVSIHVGFNRCWRRGVAHHAAPAHRAAPGDHHREPEPAQRDRFATARHAAQFVRQQPAYGFEVVFGKFCRKGFIDGRDGHVYYGNKLDQGVSLDIDAGVGDQGGKNVENIVVGDLGPFSRIIFATKIYGAGDRYCDYDGAVEVMPSDGSKFVVPLSAQQRGRWCSIARIDVDGNGASVSNLNQVSDSEPHL